ncbi:MAG: beta-ketoacyl synthase N-terminal-like domain-containing protein, partial [Planctomycetota bacterium]
MTEPTASLSPNKQALLKIRELKQQLERTGAGNTEPVAVVSMACRFPKSADTPEKFWQSLIRQDDLVGEIPEDRWDLEAFYDEDPEVPGKMYARKGVFLENLSMMDPEFFGISPREATWVDPQQRLLLEVGWEAIERAGWVPEEIADETGVFVGWMHNDYQNEASDSFLNLNPYIATGAAGSFLCGRLAWHLGLRGPSLAVDTACSSSLVALHLAIASLTRGDCNRALIGGVNAICSPTTNILTCKLKALSPQGHSRAFDADADGYLRGEGCGVVALRRLSDAKRDGDHILGIIRGSAIGHNGSGSGLTVPNPKAQEDVIRKALQRAGFAANEVDYLEAHGTGTSLGDPIEVNAAAAAYCSDRGKDDPLLIGSVKTNIGHLEAAAGMAGLIKVLLSLQKGSIPGQMNFETPNPHISWDKTPVKVLTEETRWPSADRRRAGVSAFGMSGTNAHVILEAPESAFDFDSDSSSEAASLPPIITLSGKSEEAVFDLADSWTKTLHENPDASLADLARQSNIARRHFEHRASIVASDYQHAAKLMQALARGGDAE